MKTLATLLLLSCSLFGQAQHQGGFPIDEATIYGNRTFIVDYGIHNDYGWGAGIYKSFMDSNSVHFIIGLEFNLIKWMADGEYCGRFCNKHNVSNTMSAISIPLALRFVYGNRTKFFYEVGGYGDFIIGSRTKGTRYTAVNNQTTAFDDTGNLSGARFGTTFTLGLSFMALKKVWIIKCNYKLGLMPVKGDYDDYTATYLRVGIGLSL